MKIIVGDLWSEIGKADILLVTTNARITKQGKLVMGRGAALEARERFPGIDVLLAEKVMAKHCEFVPSRDDNLPYGIIYSGRRENGTRLGAFQVKWSWDEPASLDLIQYSTEMLAKIAPNYQRIALNYPGIGNGRCTREEVEPILMQLPDHCYIYQKA